MANNGTEVDLLFQQWNGQIVPRSFNAGFVTLSYVVSLIGAASTLELINRRTAPRGKFNHLLLVSAAITMGGIAIWCMHYIGNRAIDLADGDTRLQIAYSSGFTALSFFVPIVVLLAAFIATGASNQISWWRVSSGGALAGTAICGMHYLGNASISNYVCVYNIVNVVGSALIAVAASIIALAVFFVFRASWTAAWWKRAISAILLAGAVSGMHWTAATGTQYRLLSLHNDSTQLSRNTTVIVVICLSVGACFIMAGTAMYTARIMQRYANKAQQVVLAAAVFDTQGRVLVSPDGLLPSERITDSFVERTPQDSFTEAHPLFHWMFRASRNWTSITSLIPGINSHLAQLPQSVHGVKLVNDHGDAIDKYDVVFKELFCRAANSLAEKMKVQLTSVGQLWDEILPTGSYGSPSQRRQREVEQILENDGTQRKSGTMDTVVRSEEDLAEKGVNRQQVQDVGRGSLMLLVRRVESTRDIEALEAAGYRFAELHQVSGIIGSSMQIKIRGLEARLRGIAEYGQENALVEPVVHMGLFGIRARVSSRGFDILVQKGARSLLPCVPLLMDRLEPWHIDFLRQFDRMSPHAISRALETMNRLSSKEKRFASLLNDGMASMRASMDDPVFDESMFTARIVDIPCSPEKEQSVKTTAMIAFRIVIPIHLQVTSSRCDFIPLSFFKVQQLCWPGSSHHLVFSRAAHREISPLINSLPPKKPKPTGTRPTLRESAFPNRLRRLGRAETAGPYSTVDADGNPIPTKLNRTTSETQSTQSGSTLKLWSGSRSSNEPHTPSADSSFETAWKAGNPTTQQSSFGGIMVSQEITVQVQDGRDKLPSTPASPASTTSQHRASQNRGAGEASVGQIGVTSTATAGRTSASEGAIEMRNLGGRAKIHAGSGVQVSNVEAQGPSESSTWVDDLFSVCIEGR